MSDTYDTYGDQYGEPLVGDEACCCCDDSAEVEEATAAWAPVADDLVSEPVYDVDEPATETPVGGAYEPVAYEPVAEVVYEPVATPAPVVAFAPMPSPAPVVEPAAAIISGAGVIGGGDAYGGMTIVDPAGNVVDPAALSASVGVVGPSTTPVFGHGFEMVPDPNAPTYANPMPTVPIYPTEDDSINDIAVRHVSTMAALNSLARSQDPNR